MNTDTKQTNAIEAKAGKSGEGKAKSKLDGKNADSLDPTVNKNGCVVQ